MKCYIYCTKGGRPLSYTRVHEGCTVFSERYEEIHGYSRKEIAKIWGEEVILNGKIVASFDLNKVEKTGLDTGNGLEFVNNFNKESQLTLEEIANYVGDNYYYAWHIENLEILDEPLELSKFHKPMEKWFYYGCEKFEKAPQSWCYANYNNELCIIISIKPEWVCKILNGEKTIEVRKTAPKELLK